VSRQGQLRAQPSGIQTTNSLLHRDYGPANPLGFSTRRLGFDLRSQERKHLFYQQLTVKCSLQTLIEHSKESLARETISNGTTMLRPVLAHFEPSSVRLCCALIGYHIHAAYGMGSRASRDALQVGPDGLQVRRRAVGPLGRLTDDAATYCPYQT
jgi:hypothetical protein